MRRMAVVFSVLSVILLVIGIVEDATNYKWSAGDQNAFFGNPRLLMNDGKTALILGGFMIVVSLALWMMARRKDQGNQRQS